VAQQSPEAAVLLSQVAQKAHGALDAMTRGEATGTANVRAVEPTGAKSPAGDANIQENFSELPHETIFGPALSTPTAQGPFAISEAAVDSASGLEELGSLYEQLFPEDNVQPEKVEGSHEPIPRLWLPQQKDIASQGIVIRPSDVPEMEVERKKTILILTGASKTLTEDDFRRARPRGKHLQEWTKRGEYERVIPVRDFWTLERTGDYYIVFNHSKKADAFLAHVKRVYNLTKTHTPTSLLSELPPAQSDLLRDGADDEGELVRNFTLVSPSMSLNLQRLDKGIKAEVLQRGAYPQVLAGGHLTPETPQVVLDLSGGVMPNWFQIRDAIARDGTRRSLPWDLIRSDLAIRRLAMERPSFKADIETDYESLQGDGANELVARDNDLSNYDSSSSRGVNDYAATMLARERLERGENGQRWVIAFKEREEAQRFARQWHMRGFPWTETEYRMDRVYQGTTRMKTEVLW
jgi:hypothetical protein